LTIRLLQAIASGDVTLPAGAVVYLERGTPEVFRWLRSGVAEVLREDWTEQAVVSPYERAVIGAW